MKIIDYVMEHPIPFGLLLQGLLMIVMIVAMQINYFPMSSVIWILIMFGIADLFTVSLLVRGLHG